MLPLSLSIGDPLLILLRFSSALYRYVWKTKRPLYRSHIDKSVAYKRRGESVVSFLCQAAAQLGYQPSPHEEQGHARTFQSGGCFCVHLLPKENSHRNHTLGTCLLLIAELNFSAKLRSSVSMTVRALSGRPEIVLCSFKIAVK